MRRESVVPRAPWRANQPSSTAGFVAIVRVMFHVLPNDAWTAASKSLALRVAVSGSMGGIRVIAVLSKSSPGRRLRITSRVAVREAARCGEQDGAAAGRVEAVDVLL